MLCSDMLLGIIVLTTMLKSVVWLPSFQVYSDYQVPTTCISSYEATAASVATHPYGGKPILAVQPITSSTDPILEEQEDIQAQRTKLK